MLKIPEAKKSIEETKVYVFFEFNQWKKKTIPAPIEQIIAPYLNSFVYLFLFLIVNHCHPSSLNYKKFVSVIL